MRRSPLWPALVLLVLPLVLAPVATALADASLPAPPPPAAAARPSRLVRLPSGLQYVDLRVGTGPMPLRGQMVRTHYVGTLLDGHVFDSSRRRAQPFKFRFGQGMVIRGWEEGLATMRVGGIRRLVIPPALGYGDRGAGGVIPPGATLVFEVELLSATYPPDRPADTTQLP